MSDYPVVIALIITYRRLQLALETIRSVKQRLSYPNIGFHIADDGSGPEYVERLLAEIGGSYSVEVTDAQRQGVGANMNLGIAAALKRADLWLHLEDDWVLREPLDLEPCVRLLMGDESIGMVRLARLSGGLRGATFGAENRVWWRLERNSDTYVFVGGAALRHRRFHDAFGPYRRGLAPGETELAYCGRFNNVEGPDIVWPAWLNPAQTFQHIGDHQSFKWWMGDGGKTADEAAVMFEEMDNNA